MRGRRGSLPSARTHVNTTAMKTSKWLWIAVGGLCLLGAATAPQALHFPTHRFSIVPLEGRTAGATSVLLSMYLPASNGFAPNVTVVAQNAPASIDVYIAASKRELEQNGWKLVNLDKPNDHTVVFEYTGDLQNRPLHWYAKAVLKGREVLLATGTATELQWAADGARLKECADSLQHDGGKE